MSKIPRIDWSRAGSLLRRIRAASDLDWNDLTVVAFALFAIDHSNRDVAAALRVMLDDTVNWQRVFRGQAGVALEQIESVLIRIAAPKLARFLRKQYNRLDETARGQLIQVGIERGADVLEGILILADVEDTDADTDADIDTPAA